MPVLVTHSGAFHSDELMALALLQRFVVNRPVRLASGLSLGQIKSLLKGEGAPGFSSRWSADGVEDCRTPCTIVRTRDAEVLSIAKQSTSTWVLDVGGEYNPQQLNFDHHQDSMREQWEDGTPYSCAGLVWRWIMDQGAAQGELSPEVAQDVGLSLIRGLDSHDNGVLPFPEAIACEGYNRNQVDETIAAEQFEKALAFMSDVLDNAIHQARAKVGARQVLQRAWEQRSPGQRYVVLESAMDYPDGTGLLKEVSNGEALLLGLPGKSNRYNLISTSLENRFESACPVPEAWRGKMDFLVQDDLGDVSIAFAHKTGFMCVVEGGPSEAVRVARMVLAE